MPTHVAGRPQPGAPHHNFDINQKLAQVVLGQPELQRIFTAPRSARQMPGSASTHLAGGCLELIHRCGVGARTALERAFLEVWRHPHPEIVALLRSSPKWAYRTNRWPITTWCGPLQKSPLPQVGLELDLQMQNALTIACILIKSYPQALPYHGVNTPQSNRWH
jgi:hypothetical protein